jgi:hypothetical protein
MQMPGKGIKPSCSYSRISDCLENIEEIVMVSEQNFLHRETFMATLF